MGRAIDIIHFRSISRRHSGLYDEIMLPQRTAILARLDNDQTVISRSKMESIKRDIVLVPGRWCTYGKLRQRTLQSFHIMSNRNVVCGTLLGSGFDFLSVFLRSDRSDLLVNWVLLATFDEESRLPHIGAFRLTQSKRYGPSEIQITHSDVLNFDMDDLLMLLKRKYTEHPGLGGELWTMESECKQSQRRKVNDMLACGRRTCADIPDACAALCTGWSCAVCSCFILECLFLCTIVIGFYFVLVGLITQQ